MDRKHIVVLVSIVWSTLSLFVGIQFISRYYKNGIYQIEEMEKIFSAIIAVGFAVVIIYFFCSFICNAIFNNGEERKICFYSLPFLMILITSLLTGISATHIDNYYTGDEKVIWDAATSLYPFFFVYTSEIFLICFFILPTVMAPSIIKIVFSSLVMGYTVNRVKDFYKTNTAFVLYGLCLIKPIYELGIRVHRMHWYGMLYLFFAVKIYFDSRLSCCGNNHMKEGEGSKKPIKRDRDTPDKGTSDIKGMKTIVFMSILCAVLTVLRREGMYLFIFGAAMMVLAYAKDNGRLKKELLYKVLVIFAVTEVLFYLPAAKNGFGEKGTTYRAYLVHMLGERSFDRELVSEELSVIDQYMSIEIIDKYNQDMGIGGFGDCMYDWSWWRDGSYYALRANPTVSSDEFAKNVFKIIKKEPVVFIKSRIRAFCAAARSSDTYNLFLPLFMLITIIGFSIRKRDRQLGILSFGVLVHTGITALTMPASYYKYFHQMALFSYTFIIIMLIHLYLESNQELKVREQIR